MYLTAAYRRGSSSGQEKNRPWTRYPLNFFPEVDHSSVSSVRFPDAPRKARRLFGNDNQMNMIGHQAPRKEADAVMLPLLPEKMKARLFCC